MGAVVTQLVFFSGSTNLSTQTGILGMGLAMLVSTCSAALLYSPHWGGMFCSPSPPSTLVYAEDYMLLH